MHKSRRNQQPHQGSGNNIIIAAAAMIILRILIVILKYVGHLSRACAQAEEKRKTLLFPSNLSFGLVSFDAALGFGIRFC